MINVEIITITDCEQYEVNGKLVYLDELGNWRSDHELSQTEKLAFKSYVELILKDLSIKKVD